MVRVSRVSRTAHLLVAHLELLPSWGPSLSRGMEVPGADFQRAGCVSKRLAGVKHAGCGAQDAALARRCPMGAPGRAWDPRG
jgi:hypothetical protein